MNKLRKRPAFIALLLGLGLLGFFQNCDQSGVVFSKTSESLQSQLNNAGNNQLICDPFHQEYTDCNRGFVGDVFALPAKVANRPENKNLNAYFSKGSKINPDNSSLVFPKILFPTQIYNHGFAYNNSVLKRPNGDKLFEWFALNLVSILKLRNQDQAGFYQFALISDDGSRLMKIHQDNSTSLIVDNDGFSTTRMRCADQAIYLNHSSTLPLRLQYFQGPRNAIALALVWRRVTSANVDAPLDQAGLQHCNHVGAYFFGDYQTDPRSRVIPQAGTAWKDIHDQGWRSLAVENLYQFK